MELSSRRAMCFSLLLAGSCLHAFGANLTTGEGSLSERGGVTASDVNRDERTADSGEPEFRTSVELRLDTELSRAATFAANGLIDEAARVYRDVVRVAPNFQYRLIAHSGLNALGRQAERFDLAFQAIDALRVDRPDLEGLWDIWEGDTLLAMGEPAMARALYNSVLEAQSDLQVDSLPLGLVALRQMSRVALELGEPAAAAAAQREILDRYARYTDPIYTLAQALAFDEAQAGRLPFASLGELMHEGNCSSDRPCILGSGEPLPNKDFAALELRPTKADQELLERARRTSLYMPTLQKTTACTTPTASNGWDVPLANDHAGYTFMNYPDSSGGYHPGLDVNGPGSGDADCGLTIKTAAQGCVTDAGTSTWGSLTIQTKYTPDTWTHQYGHAQSVYVSYGAAVTKLQSVAAVGKVGTSTCHLHFEVREWDHPDKTNADYYNVSSQINVGKYYQDPYPFIAAHFGYRQLVWKEDSNGFTRAGTWTRVVDRGDYDSNDLYWAVTTSSKTNYATASFTASYSGTYEFWTFVPWDKTYASSTMANHLIKLGDTQLLNVDINQANTSLKDTWVKVGSVNLTAGKAYTIQVGSKSTESSKRVALDNVLVLIK